MIDVTEEDLPHCIEGLSAEALNALPFGVIRVDPVGRVTFFNRRERKQSDFPDSHAFGRGYFSDLAPCMGTDDFQRRLDRAMAAGTVDLAFEHVGDFDDPDRELRVRVTSATGGGLWLFIQRLR